MGVLKSNNPTLADVASRMDDKGNISDIIEMLTETNEILEDATWLEPNGFT